ncbi:MAG: FAD-linked oxidase C-terminal domain-containing protein, partial [Patescibacteria group bacterium]
GVLPIPKYTRLVAVFLKDISRLGNVVVEALKHKPVSLESYDDKTFRLALRFIPGLIRLMKGNAILLGLSFLPEFFLLLRGGLPKMVVLAEFSGDDEKELSGRISNFSAGMKNLGGRVRVMRSEREAEKYRTIRRQSFKLLHEHTKDRETAPFIDDVIVKPEFLPEFLPQLNAILDPYKDKMTYTVAGHPGDGNFHVIPLMDLKDEQVRSLIPKISEEVYDLVLKYGGSITAEHNDGLIRTPYLEKMFGREMVKLFEEVKNIFDPLGIFNPGKKVGGDLKYALDHIKR